MASVQASRPEVPSAKLESTAQQPRGDSAQPASQGGYNEQPPTGDSTQRTSQPEVPSAKLENTAQQPAGDSAEPAGGGGYNDEAFNKRVKDTEEKVFQTFHKVFSHLHRPAAHTTGETGSDSKEGEGDKHSKSLRQEPGQEEDSMENQMKNTTAQIIGTLRGLSNVFHQAEEKIHHGAKKADSSEKSPIAKESDTAKAH